MHVHVLPVLLLHLLLHLTLVLHSHPCLLLLLHMPMFHSCMMHVIQLPVLVKIPRGWFQRCGFWFPAEDLHLVSEVGTGVNFRPACQKDVKEILVQQATGV